MTAPGRARAVWAFASVSCCASIAASVLVALSFTLGSAALRANPTCATYTPAVPLVATLRIERLTGAGCLVIAWLGAVAARRAAVAPGGLLLAGRAAQILATVALVGLILSFCSYNVSAFGTCIG